MKKQYKTSYKMYSAWNYELEIEDLNKASKDGWQLVKGGSFSSRFKYNPDICYRYQLDYQPNIEDMGRYIETFREQGWEYVNTTFNGWHYFRKLYDPALPEEQYEIFTDLSSIAEMNGRWVKPVTGLSVFMAIYVLIELAYFMWMPKLPTLITIFLFGFMLFVFVRAIFIMRNPDKRKNNPKDHILLAVFFATIILNCILTIAGIQLRPSHDGTFSADYFDPIPASYEDAVEWNTVTVTYPDNYYLDLEIEAESPVTLSILDENGESIYSVTETSYEISNKKIYLDKGIYQFYLSDFAGGKIEITADLD